MDGILGSGAEWQGATSKWHIQSKDRRDVGPQGPAHWPRRPFDVGGFCDSVHNAQPRGQRHFVDLPTSVLPSTTREQQWRSSSRRVEAFCEEFDRPTGTKRIVPNNLEGNEGWTGKLNNYTGPRHFNVKNTSVNPTDGNSYFVEKKMGTKKAVFSSSMGLPQHYEENERRCQRPAEEWSLDTKMQRKIRLPNHEDRRNGINMANPGDKSYGTAEHAPEYVAKTKEMNRARSNTERMVMSKVDKSWSVSGADPTLDKKGRKMSDYIQIYCKTPYRKNSMYVHRNAAVSEVADLAGEGGSRKQSVHFKGMRLSRQHHLLELGITAKSTLDLVLEDEVIIPKAGYRDKEARKARSDEADAVLGLSALALDQTFPATDREDYADS